MNDNYRFFIRGYDCIVRWIDGLIGVFLEIEFFFISFFLIILLNMY